jgi:hypothetical protein
MLAQRPSPDYEAQATKMALTTPKSLPDHQYTMGTAKIKFHQHSKQVRIVKNIESGIKHVDSRTDFQ